ncbi:ABC transporter ATP-binding protein [Anaerosalibacter bizertensis]|uniref:ABC transporter ATP-binding protein n=1 Tax=Anaerosalibacter bizertensis TaxID=932217 RepID=UPI001D02E182|nr:ABC transporter ATP-binding protein [Anaerosalibacter bizertensis]MCB5558363.1 ABC transporter ATP-binding protein [Anaerosalibacter bizertensis]
MNSKKILGVRNLHVSFKTYAGVVQAVRGVDFYLEKGETLAIVGESGCGKTVTVKTIMGLLPKEQSIVSGEGVEVNFHGKNLLDFRESEMSNIRGNHISMIFQDPMTSLNPTMKIGDQIAESIIIHENKSEEEAKKIALNMLELVNIPNAKERINQYPFELSGGMRQRIMIGIALACDPEILIADEPTTALDVTIQAQIMDLIKKLQNEKNTGVILVTHDLGVVASVADRIQVMYAGEVVERGRTNEIFYNTKHPYTFALLESIPKLSDNKQKELYSLVGTPPDLTNPPRGCPFVARCKYAMKICRVKHPERISFGETHESSCWLHHEKADLSGVSEILLKRGVADAESK